MTNAFQLLLAEPRAENPPRRVWRDWALLAVILPGILLESLLRDDLNAMPYTPIVIALIALLLLWRRQHPMAVWLLVFGHIIVFDLVAVALGSDASNMGSAAFVLLFQYALFRWASGREILLGAVLGLGVVIVSSILSYTGVGDMIGGFIALEFPAALGLSVRYATTARKQAIKEAKLQERETIARELHDTVAHHVSAIAIQAQAGRFLARSDSLDGAAKALETIEEEASRTLDEMRSMISGLRDADTPAEMAPQHGIRDIEALASSVLVDATPVAVTLEGDLESTRPALGAAVYRLAQESVTNAARHARNAKAIDVHVSGDATAVHLTVVDDGDPAPRNAASSGFGLIGMAERAALLGGTFEAGPGQHRGWVVKATLPREVPV